MFSNFISTKQFQTRTELENFFEFVKQSHFPNLQGKILISWFAEPSTRTSLSFSTAMLKLGGQVITVQENMSSIKKGESWQDTIAMLSEYGDILVIRSPDNDAAE